MLLGKRDAEEAQFGHTPIDGAPRVGLALLHIPGGCDRPGAGCPAADQFACGKLLVRDRGGHENSCRLEEKAMPLTRTCSNSASARPSSRPPLEQDTSTTQRARR